MIETVNLTKKFDDVTAVDHVDAEIREGCVFGLVGTNGAGKSTFLRLAAGILKPDEGTVRIDGAAVYGNAAARQSFFYIPDDQYFFSNVTPREMAHFFRGIYPAFDADRFSRLLTAFELPEKRKINTFSKGMKKQLSILLGISSGTKYLFCDETFDGLDPVMRQAVKSLLANDMSERGLTPVITSHNLRELEDICDHVGLLHKGGILFSRDLEDMKLNIHKVQCVLKPEQTKEALLSLLTDTAVDAALLSAEVTKENAPGEAADASSKSGALSPNGFSSENGGHTEEPASRSGLTLLLTEQRGSILTLTVRGSGTELASRMEAFSPLFYEIVPLSLEEIFISETEVKGYDIKKLIF